VTHCDLIGLRKFYKVFPLFVYPLVHFVNSFECLFLCSWSRCWMKMVLYFCTFFSIIHSVFRLMSNDVSILPVCFIRVLCVSRCSSASTSEPICWPLTKRSLINVQPDVTPALCLSVAQINRTHRRTEELGTWVENLRNLCVLHGKSHLSLKPKRELLLGKFPHHDREISPRL
jgi:hypothetical protein